MAKMKLADFTQGAGAAAQAEKFSRVVSVDDIKTDHEIMRVFSIDEKVLGMVVKSMVEGGYDYAQPVTVWRRDGGSVLVDGHTRLRAALRAGLKEIPVCDKEFASKEDAIFYTFRRQAERRNLTQAEILNASNMLQRKAKNDGSGSAAGKLAGQLGISEVQVHRARKVQREASESDLADIQRGVTTINKVYQKIKEGSRDGRKDGALLVNVDLRYSLSVLNTIINGGGVSGDIMKRLREVLENVFRALMKLDGRPEAVQVEESSVVAEARRLLDAEVAI